MHVANHSHFEVAQLLHENGADKLQSSSNNNDVSLFDKPLNFFESLVSRYLSKNHPYIFANIVLVLPF